MSYDVVERSKEDGTPVYLYHFKINEHEWHFTNAPTDLEVSGATWAAGFISDDGVKQRGDRQADVLNIQCDWDNPVARLFKQRPPGKPVKVVIRRHHLSQPVSIVCFVGEITEVDLPSPGVASIVCLSVGSTLDRGGVRLTWMRTCPHSLYDKRCKVDPNEHSLPTTITGLSLNTITVSDEMATRMFAGGFLRWVSPLSGEELIPIESHNANTLVIMGVTNGMSVSDEVTLFKGCDRDIITCREKFNNMPNFGGVPAMPIKSPFDGNPEFIVGSGSGGGGGGGGFDMETPGIYEQQR